MEVNRKIYGAAAGLPLGLIILAGVLSPFMPNSYLIGAGIAGALVLSALIFHEPIFVSRAGGPDPLPAATFAAYGTVAGAMGIVAALFILTGFEHLASRMVGLSWEISTTEGLLVTGSTGLSVGGTLSGLVWIVLFPILGALGLMFLVGTQLWQVISHLLLGALLLGLLFVIGMEVGQSLEWMSSISKLTVVAGAILLLSGLITTGILITLIRLPSEVLQAFADQKTAIVLPLAIGVADLVSVAQGLTGLMAHYPAMETIAFSGIIALILSLLAAVGFLVKSVSGTIQQGSLGHWMLSLSLSLCYSSLFIYLFGEAGGFVLTNVLA